MLGELVIRKCAKNVIASICISTRCVLSFNRTLGEHVILAIKIYYFCYFNLKCHMKWKMVHRTYLTSDKMKPANITTPMTRATFWFSMKEKKIDTTSFDFGSIRVANDLPTHNLEYVHVYFVYTLHERYR